MTVYIFVSLRVIWGSMLLWRAWLLYILPSLSFLKLWINRCTQTERGCTLTFAGDHGTDFSPFSLSPGSVLWQTMLLVLQQPFGTSSGSAVLGSLSARFLWSNFFFNCEKLCFENKALFLSIIKSICWVVFFFFLMIRRNSWWIHILCTIHTHPLSKT